MSKPLFDLAKCGVPFVNSVDFRFVSECSIQPPPPPIFDCPEPPKTFRVVPECPSIDGSIMISTAAEGCIPPRKNLIITRTPRCGGNQEAGCNFFIDLDLSIPIPTPPCPSIAGSVQVKTFPAGCPRPKNSLRIKPKRSRYSNCTDAKSKPGCLFDLDLSINVPIPTPPCPSIKGGSVKTSVFFKGCKTPKQSIHVRKRSLPKPPCGSNSSYQKPPCYHTIDVELDIPIPRPPCPSIKGGSVKTSVFFKGCKTPKQSIRVRKKSLPTPPCGDSVTPNCIHTIDIELDIPVPRPPCPSISGGSLSLSVTLEPCKRKNKIKVRKRSLPPPPCGDSVTPNCAHTIDIDLTIPVPKISCPSLTVTNNPGPRPSITRTKTTTASCGNALRPPRCEFTINIPPTCGPEFSTGSVSLSISHETCVKSKKNRIKTRKLKTDQSDSCVVAIDLDLAIPVPKISCPSLTVTNNPAPRPSITRKKTTVASCGNALRPPRCEFTINIPPPPPCPAFSKGSFSVATTTGKPTGVLKVRKLEPKNSSSCRFAIDFKIKVPVPPCPEFSKGSFSVATTTGKPTGVLKVRKLEPKNSSSCRFAIDFDLKIPVPPCPAFSKGSFSVATTTGKPTGILQVRKLEPKNSSSCRFAIDFNLKIPVPPCPDFSKGSFSVTTTTGKPTGILKARKLEPKNSSSCRFAIDFNLKIPVPPCPDFSKGSFSVTTTTGKPSGILKTRKLEPKNSSSCRFAIDFNLKIPVPPCPEFSKGSFSVTTTTGKPTGILKARKLAPKNSSSCRFAIDFNLKIPVPPCPDFSKGSFSVTTTTGKPTGILKARKLEPKNSSSCRFAIDFNLKIPVPPCPDFSKGSFSVTTTTGKPTGILKARKLEPKNSSSCRFAIDFNLKIPVPPCPDFSKGSFSVTTTTGKPTGVLKARKLAPKNSSSCRFAIDFNLKIPVPPCPDFSKGSFSVTTTTGKPTGILKARKLEPKNSSSCRFAIDFNLKIPVPPCPDFSKGSFSVTTTTGKPTGILKARKLEPKNSSSCRFAIDFNLKIPVPPCPDFSKGSFSVTTTTGKPTGILKARKLAPKNSSSCRYAIDFNLKIPVPPCPDFSKGSFSAKMEHGIKNPTGILKARKLEPRNSSSCRYAIDFNLKIPVPPCPDFSKGSFSAKMEQGIKHPTGILKVRKLEPRNSSSCRYAVDFNIKIPVPACAQLSISQCSVSTYDPEELPTNARGKITVKQLPPIGSSSCRTGLGLRISIPVPKEIQRGEFTGNWDKGSSKQITVNKDDGTTKNVSVLNELCNVKFETGTAVCYIGRDTTDSQWYLLNWECEYCNDKGTKAKKVSDNNAKDASSTSGLEDGDGAQVLLNDGGCAKWFGVKKQKIIYDLEAYNRGLKWKEREVWVLIESGGPTDKDIECAELGADYKGGTIDLGNYGSGQITVTGDCPEKTIAATITLNTTSCDTGGGSGGG